MQMGTCTIAALGVQKREHQLRSPASPPPPSNPSHTLRTHTRPSAPFYTLLHPSPTPHNPTFLHTCSLRMRSSMVPAITKRTTVIGLYCAAQQGWQVGKLSIGCTLLNKCIGLKALSTAMHFECSTAGMAGEQTVGGMHCVQQMHLAQSIVNNNALWAA